MITPTASPVHANAYGIDKQPPPIIVDVKLNTDAFVEPSGTLFEVITSFQVGDNGVLGPPPSGLSIKVL